VDPAQARAPLATFGGVRRRLELRGTPRGIAVYDDFAHHPTAVRETLRALRSAAGTGRLIALFEPRSYTSRTSAFQDAFADAFRGADHVVVAAAHLPARIPEAQRLSESALAATIARSGAEATFIPGVDAIVSHVATLAREGDLVVVLSNGGFGGIHDKLLGALAGPARA
jgi:UDP-N-acetylmuramate: L-alanyl-gamma-D-glutamyl-meso-diaminopimelate ligase